MSLKLVTGLTVVIALLVFESAVAGVSAGTCRKDGREISVSKKNVVRLSDYVCRSDRDAASAVRIQFQRLSGLAAGALLNSGSTPWDRALYGKYRIAENDVLKEYRNLIARFGSAVRAKNIAGGGVDVSLSVNIPEQASDGDPQYVNAETGAEVRSFRLPDLPDIPLVDETIGILTRRAWPGSLNMFYSVQGWDASNRPNTSPLDEMTVWRYVTPADFSEYAQRLERYNSLVVNRDDFARKPMPKSIQLLEYLTAGGWPQSFVDSSATIMREESCAPLDFQTFQYFFVVDIAVIENISSKPIEINQLLGRIGDDNRLRQISTSLAHGYGGALPADAVTLAPAERLLIPLRLIFAVDSPWASRSGLDDEERQRSEANFQRITSSRPSAVFQTEIYSALRGAPKHKDMFVISKVRESFKPPSYPVHSDFAFGPEWTLTGLLLGGERIVFDAMAPNFLEITAANEIGSCPILYAWSAPDATWIRHGKIIHQAQSRVSEQSETVAFEGFVNRFRIAEEELERATIDGMVLKLEFADGDTLSLLPARATLGVGEGIELFANEEIEIDFALPPDRRASDVVRSQLIVTGYYDRYAALLLSRLESRGRSNRDPSRLTTSSDQPVAPSAVIKPRTQLP